MQPEDLQSLLSVLRFEFIEMRHDVPARQAPGCEEIDKEDPATVIGKGYMLP